MSVCHYRTSACLGCPKTVPTATNSSAYALQGWRLHALLLQTILTSGFCLGNAGIRRTDTANEEVYLEHSCGASSTGRSSQRSGASLLSHGGVSAAAISPPWLEIYINFYMLSLPDSMTCNLAVAEEPEDALPDPSSLLDRSDMQLFGATQSLELH